jgi:hypothetical protein
MSQYHLEYFLQLQEPFGNLDYFLSFPNVTQKPNKFPRLVHRYCHTKINPLFLSTPKNPSHSIPLIVANSVTIVNYFPPFVNISLLETGSQHRVKYCSGWNYIAVFFLFLWKEGLENAVKLLRALFVNYNWS